MSDFEEIDPSLYTRPPVISLASGISLGKALLAALPTGMPASVKKAADRLRTTVDMAESAWVARQRADQAVGEESTRAIDLILDQAWSALRSRLIGYAQLWVEDHPKAPRAAEIDRLLFSEGGLGFLKTSYPEQAALMAALLRRIDEEGLAKELDDLCGPEFLRNVKKLQPRYEAMVQAMLRRGGGGPDLGTQVRAIGRAIVGYATRVVASVEEDDAKSVARAREALRPLDVYRASYPAAPGTKKPEPEPEPSPGTP